MSLRDPVLVAHVLSGTAGLVLGPIAMRAPKRRGRHPQVGRAYHLACLGVFLTAVPLALMDLAELWWFIPIALWSYGLALGGVLARRRRRPGWLRRHIRGMGGSYIALVTALLVVNAGEGALAPLAWALPTLVGVPLIERAVARARQGPVSPARRPAKIASRWRSVPGTSSPSSKDGRSPGSSRRSRWSHRGARSARGSTTSSTRAPAA